MSPLESRIRSRESVHHFSRATLFGSAFGLISLLHIKLYLDTNSAPWAVAVVDVIWAALFFKLLFHVSVARLYQGEENRILTHLGRSFARPNTAPRVPPHENLP